MKATFQLKTKRFQISTFQNLPGSGSDITLLKRFRSTISRHIKVVIYSAEQHEP